jgi:hypothetical protein
LTRERPNVNVKQIHEVAPSWLSSGMDARAGEAPEQAGARGDRVIADRARSTAISRYSRADTCCFAPAAARLDERFGRLPA